MRADADRYLVRRRRVVLRPQRTMPSIINMLMPEVASGHNHLSLIYTIDTPIDATTLAIEIFLHELRRWTAWVECAARTARWPTLDRQSGQVSRVAAKLPAGNGS